MLSYDLLYNLCRHHLKALDFTGYLNSFLFDLWNDQEKVTYIQIIVDDIENHTNKIKRMS